jgi:hypothetical protein
MEYLDKCGDPEYPTINLQIGHIVRHFRKRLDLVRAENDAALILHKDQLARCADDDPNRQNLQKRVEAVEEKKYLLGCSLKAIENVSVLGKLKRLRQVADELKTMDSVPYHHYYENVRRPARRDYAKYSKAYKLDEDIETWLEGWKTLPGTKSEVIKKWVNDLVKCKLSIEDERRAPEAEVRTWVDGGENTGFITHPEATHTFWKDDILSNERIMAGISDGRIRHQIETTYVGINASLEEVKKSGKLEPVHGAKDKSGDKEEGSGSKRKRGAASGSGTRRS